MLKPVTGSFVANLCFDAVQLQPFMRRVCAGFGGLSSSRPSRTVGIRAARDQDLFGAPTIHVHHLETPAGPYEAISRFRHLLQLRHQEAAKCYEISRRRALPPDEVGYVGYGHRGIDQKGAVVPPRHLRPRGGIDLREVARDRLQKIGAGDNAFHSPKLIRHDGGVDWRLASLPE